MASPTQTLLRTKKQPTPRRGLPDPAWTVPQATLPCLSPKGSSLPTDCSKPCNGFPLPSGDGHGYFRSLLGPLWRGHGHTPDHVAPPTPPQPSLRSVPNQPSSTQVLHMRSPEGTPPSTAAWFLRALQCKECFLQEAFLACPPPHLQMRAGLILPRPLALSPSLSAGSVDEPRVTFTIT